MVRLTNQERAQAGLPELKPSDHLRQAAREHSRLMAERGELSHQLRGEPELSTRVAAQGVRFNSIGENVSLTSQQPPAQRAHAGLMRSPPHRANILAKDFNQIGVGVARRGNLYYITEDFVRGFTAMSAADAEQAAFGALNDFRRKQHMQSLRLVRLDRLNTMACEPRTTLDRLLAAFISSRGAVLSTTWTPGELSRPMIEMASEESAREVSLKACPMEEARGGNGGFRIAAVFF